MGAASVLGAGFGIYQSIQGAKERRNAERALNDYQRQELTNVAEGQQVSTLGSDLQRQEQARLASGQIGALQEGGTRSMIGGLGRVEAGNQRVMQQTGADLDMQQKQIDQMRAEDDVRIRNMQENREIGDLSALSSQAQAGKQDMYSGFGNIVQAAGGIQNSLKGAGQLGGSQGGLADATVSGTPVDMVNKNYQSPVGGGNTYNPANTYGNFFSQNPYVQQQGPQNAPSWYTNASNIKF